MAVGDTTIGCKTINMGHITVVISVEMRRHQVAYMEGK